MTDIEQMLKESKDAQRYAEIQSSIKDTAKTMGLYKVICGLNLAAAGCFGFGSYVNYSHNNDNIGMLNLITTILFTAASGINYGVFRINKNKRDKLLEEAKGLEARVD
ncbi:MAG: hypothetical protein PHO02_04155 [Candidatus Nanoarchaeia archaeon]|nr:hypothetical protein [Candidatus Nanoarchaeia archaeon]